MKTWRSVAILVSLGLAAAACGDGGGGGGGTSAGAEPRIEVSEGGSTVVDGSDIPLTFAGTEVGGEKRVATLQIVNNGNAPLEISELSVASEPAGHFRLVAQGDAGLPTGEAPVTVQPSDAAEGLRSYFVDVMGTRPEDGVALSGTLTIRSDSKINDAEVIEIGLSPEAGGPDIDTNPSTVDFGNVPLGESELKTVTILNTGTGDLEVTDFVLAGNPAFALLHDGEEWKVSPETAQGIELEEPLVVAPGTSEKMSVRFSPEDLNGAEGQLLLSSNDPDEPDKLIKLSGNDSGPCISINPKKVDFGGKLIGKPATVDVEILSCGEEPLHVEEIKLGEESSTDFSLNLGSLPGVEDGVGAIVKDQDTAVELDVNEAATFQVTYVPDEINELDDDGQPIPDLGEIHIVSDALVSELDVEVRGFGVEVECPTSVIVVQEGEEVIPQTKLHLIGSQSYASSGDIAQYEWSVQQPVGSQSVFLPSASAPDPTFEANVAGTYVFKLRVWDENGEESCVAAEYTVFVNPDEAIHVELLWDTPLDPDQTDEGPEAGADLDLHFLHPFATGEDVDGDGEPDGWFDQPFDCFWFNAQPNWGSLDPAVDDDPGLDRDDTDGAGPENVNLNIPEDGLTYKVGVHYWNDHGFGPSNATVRVYIYSSLVFELKNVELIDSDLWEVAEVSWPSGEVELITEEGGDYKIVPNYQHPFFPSE
ncbi:MAG: choice-of-anchor D domain-containing protein [Myxococcota bacterium]